MRYKAEIKDTIWLVALQGLNYLVPLFVWPYLMRTLGAEQFGLIGFGNTMVQFLMLVVDFGFNLTATKRIAQWKAQEHPQEELNTIFTETLLAKIALLAISFLCLLVVLAIPAFAPYRLTNCIFFGIVIGQTFSFYWLFQGLSKIRIISIISAVVRLSILPLTFAFVHQPSDVYIAAGIQSSVYLATALITIVWILCKHLAQWGEFSKQGVWQAIKDAFPIFLSNATSSVYVLLFVLILGYFTNPAVVGCYTAAEKVMRMACYALLLPITQAFYPRVSALSANHRQEGMRLSQKLLLLTTLAMLCIGGTLYILAQPLTIWLDRGYDNLTTLLHIMSIIPLFIGTGAVFGQIGLLALGGNREKRTFRNIYIVAAVFSLLLISALIPILNEIYAAIALLATETLVALLMGKAYWKMTHKK